MILYFNKYGRLLECLEYGNAAREGTTNFKIFAYFEGLEDFSRAEIRFKRPDLEGSELFNLEMTPHTFHYDPQVQSSHYFKSGIDYQGFIFDFNEVSETDSEDPQNIEKVIILDMPGLWGATITLYNNEQNTTYNVAGSLKFSVE